MSQGTIKRQVVVEDNQVAFETGEQVEIESVQPSLQNPAFKYMVFSSRLEKRFLLTDNDVAVHLSASQIPNQQPVVTKRKRFGKRK